MKLERTHNKQTKQDEITIERAQENPKICVMKLENQEIRGTEQISVKSTWVMLKNV